MTDEEAIPFRTVRDVGDLITATFAYLRQNWRSLGLALLYVVGPVLAVQLVVSSFFQGRFLALQQIENAADPGAVLSEFLVPALLLVPVSLLTGVLAVTVVYEHMRLYQEHGPGAVTVAGVWAGGKRSFGRMLGTTLGVFFGSGAVFAVVVLVGGMMIGGLSAGAGPVGAGLGVLLLFVGFACVGAYLLVFCVLLFPIRMYEDVGLRSAFRRCLRLLDGRFWKSLGVVFVVMLLYYVLAVAFSMPASIMGFVLGLNGSDGGASAVARVVLVAANAMGGIGSTAAYCIPLVAAALYYFGLVEEKEHAGLAARVEQVGSGEHGGKGPAAEASPFAPRASGGAPGEAERDATSDATSEAPREAPREAENEEEGEQARWRRGDDA